MAESIMTPSRKTSPASAPRYSGWIGRLAGNPIYAGTIGRIANSRAVRLTILLGVPLVWIAALHIGPIYQMLRISLLENYPAAADGQNAYTLSNYRLFFEEPLYFIPFIRTLIFAAVVTLCTLLIVYPVAYYVAKVVKPKNRVRALLLLLIPFWAGELIRTFSVIMLLANRGAVNVLLREIGLIDRPIPMLYTYFSLSFGVVYLIALYMLLPLYSAIEKIPPQLIHAADDLGAGPWQRFRRVILPLSRDGIVSGCSLVYLTTVGVFAAPLLLGGPETVIFPEVIATLFHGSNDKWPEGAAFSIIMLVVSLSTVGLFMKIVGGRSVRLM
ncbi:spermidine/putrescine transport system permease protein [Rhizobium azooxidifex]|uniref:Spermidine/putrescine transport system permease protein n=1 Tax=Mycoplana azooxidifex TaxID=1636188 RepID=A0A7W6D8N7_9HYPH|nr:ABC transporter permease [Mycoplana azooxidifex]MBB3978758.1 spermidine/putrescine transport system permease protein [Mycoplana azooxidifex]